jgi:hypothetical protein
MLTHTTMNIAMINNFKLNMSSALILSVIANHSEKFESIEIGPDAHKYLIVKYQKIKDLTGLSCDKSIQNSLKDLVKKELLEFKDISRNRGYRLIGSGIHWGDTKTKSKRKYKAKKQKEFSFNLSKRSTLSATSEEYRKKLGEYGFNLAIKNGLSQYNSAEMVREFSDYHRAKGTIAKDWSASFRTWIRNHKKFEEQKQIIDKTGLY